MKRSNKAFTLTELLVALGVIAILCAILLPVIFNLMPNQKTVMAKRAYYTAQTIVAELINDEACYPDKTTAVTNPKIGFDDAAGTPNCKKWDETKKDSTDSYTKFVTLYREKHGYPVSGSSMNWWDSDDGMRWSFSNANFKSSDSEGGSIFLTVDVNGVDKPNCAQFGATNNIGLWHGTTCGNDSGQNITSGYDRFRMVIHGNGRIEILDDWAKEAVKVNRNITSDKNSNSEDD